MTRPMMNDSAGAETRLPVLLCAEGRPRLSSFFEVQFLDRVETAADECVYHRARSVPFDRFRNGARRADASHHLEAIEHVCELAICANPFVHEHDIVFELSEAYARERAEKAALFRKTGISSSLPKMLARGVLALSLVQPSHFNRVLSVLVSQIN